MGRLVFLFGIGLGGIAVLVGLGVWQVQRLAWKQAIIADIDARIAADPVALPVTPDPVADKYLPVTVAGTLGEGAIFVLVSQRQIGAGYRVISEFVTDSGRRVLVDRGFVRLAERDAVDTGARALEVTGNLHWPEEIDSFTPEPDITQDIWFARDVAAMADALGTDPILIVAQNTSQSDGPVTPLPVDTDAIPNNHLRYAITWFSLALIWAVMTAYVILRGLGRPTERPTP